MQPAYDGTPIKLRPALRAETPHHKSTCSHVLHAVLKGAGDSLEHLQAAGDGCWADGRRHGDLALLGRGHQEHCGRVAEALL